MSYMKLKKNCFFCLICLLQIVITSCNGGRMARSYADCASIRVTPDKLEKEFDFTSVASLSKLIPLETSDKCRIGNVSRVFVIDGFFIVWDSENQKLYSFTKDGDFMSQIGGRGNSSSEYVSLTDVWVDGRSKEICLLDNSKHCLLFFDIYGTFKRNMKIDDWALNIALDDELMWLACYGQTEKNTMLKRVNSETKKGADVLSFSDDMGIPILQSHCFTRKGNDLFFSTPYMNTIYQLDDDAIPVLTIDVGEDGIKVSDMSDEKEMETVKNGRYVGGIKDFYIADSIVFFSFEDRRKVGPSIDNYYVCYSLSNEEIHVYDYSMRHDKELPISPLPDIKGVDGKNIYFIIDVSVLPAHLMTRLHENESLKDIIKESNPILVQYTLK